MRTDPPTADGASLSRRAFVVAGGTAAGTVVGSGIAAAEDGTPLVGATEPYVSSVRRAADAAPDPVRVRPVQALDASPDVLVSGRPEAPDGHRAAHDVAVDGAAALTSDAGTWRDVLPRAAVRDRWTGDRTVETWSEYDGATPDGLAELARPAALADEVSTLVRGPRAFQYAEGRGGVGYYDVDRSALTDVAEGTGSDGAVPLVRLGYAHVATEAVGDEQVSSFLDSYGDRTDGGDPTTNGFVDPALG